MWCHLDSIVTNICQQVARGLAKWTATEYSTFVHLDSIVTNICQQVARGLAKWTATEYSTFVYIRTSVVCKCIEVINILLEATRRQLKPHSCRRLHRLDNASDLNKRHISHVICAFTTSKADQGIVFVLSIHREPRQSMVFHFSMLY